MLKLVRSFNNATNGLKYSFLTQRNFRFHTLALIVVLLATMLLKLTLVEELLIIIAIGFVIISELFNTAVELLTDLYEEKYHKTAKYIKDVSAGAVMFSAIIAFMIGFFIFFRKIQVPFKLTVISFAYSRQYFVVISIVLIIVSVILIKMISHRGTPLEGGFPSGHSAVAFGIWALITVLTTDLLISTLVFVLAFVIAIGRIRDNIHNVIEIIAGGVVGVGIVLVLFKIFVR